MDIEAEMSKILKSCYVKMAAIIQGQTTLEPMTSNSSVDLATAIYVHRFCLNLTVEFLQNSKDVFDIERLYDIDLAVPIYGYITPIIAIITLVLNSTIIAIIMNKKLRSPTNIILVSIAVFDTLTILCPMPWYIKTFALRSYVEYPSLPWCRVYIVLAAFLPTVFHNTVMWLTVMLAIHRYIGIFRPNLAKRLCNYRSVIGGILSIFILMTFFHGINLYMEALEPVSVVGKELVTKSGISYIDTCNVVPARQVASVYTTYTQTYWWCRIAVGQIVPCLILTVFNSILLKQTCKSYKYRSLLVRGNHSAEIFHLQEVVRTSAMLIIICACALIVEIPLAIIFMLNILQSYHGVDISFVRVLKTIPNFIMFLFFPINFFVYMSLSSAFRRKLISIFERTKQTTRASLVALSILSNKDEI